MTEVDKFIGSRVENVRSVPRVDGYLDVLVRTDTGTFDLLHDCVKEVKEVVRSGRSILPEDYRGAVVQGVWTDEELLLVVFADGRGMVYEFTMDALNGSGEMVRFVDAASIEDYLSEPGLHQVDC